MADNKNLRDGRDRNKVAGDESYELSYLQEKLGKSRQEVKDAIEAVGNDRQKIEDFLTGNKKQ